MSNFSRGGNNRGRDGGRREMFAATCGSCGKDCQVPFRPSGGRPVLCSNCFEKEGNGTGGNRRQGRSFGERRGGGFEKRRAPKNVSVCDDCGRKCTLPFKPESGKPVYCDDCFSRHSKNGAGKSVSPTPSKDYSKEFKELNEKIDAIWNLLSEVIEVEDEIIEEIDEVLEEEGLDVAVVDLAEGDAEESVEKKTKKKKATKKSTTKKASTKK